MENWEYKEVINVNYRLNELGGQGWELCAINGNIFYFKRPMQCENCKYYKPSEYNAFDSKCEKIGLLHSHKGCKNFKPKD